MSKSVDLRNLYDSIQLTSTRDRELLGSVRAGSATDEELNELLDSVNASDGAEVLDRIKKYEDGLVADVNLCLDRMRELHDEYHSVAHWDDGKDKEDRISELRRQQQIIFGEADEIYEALKFAYFQVRDYDQYGRRFDKGKEEYEI